MPSRAISRRPSIIDAGRQAHFTRLLEWLVALLAVMGMQTVYVKTVNGHNLEMITMLTTIALIAIVFRQHNTITAKDALFLCLQASLVMVILWSNLIRDPSTLTGDAVVIALTIVTFHTLGVLWFSSKRDVFDFLIDVSRIVSVQAIVSLLFYILGSCARVLPPSGTVTTLWGGTRVFNSYYGIYFSDNDLPYGVLKCGRNTGIFVEAPMHAYMLVLALAVQLFVARNVHVWSTTIVLVTILTTYSTTGISVAIMAIALKLLNSELRFRGPLSIALVLPASIYAVRQIYNQKREFAMRSVTVRGDNFQNAWEVFLHYPVTGIGFKAESFKGLTIAHTSVVTQVLSDGGLLLFIFYFSTVLLVLFRAAIRRSWRIFSLYACYVSAGLFTVVTYTSLTILMVAFSYWVLREWSDRYMGGAALAASRVGRPDPARLSHDRET